MKLSVFSSILSPSDWGAIKLINNIVNLKRFGETEYILVVTKAGLDAKDAIRHETSGLPNVKVEFRDKDAGLYGSWNIAAQIASGEYLTNANYDDRRLYNGLDIQLGACDMGADVVYFDSLIAENESQLDNPNLCRTRSLLPEFSDGDLIRYCLPFCNPIWKRNLHTDSKLLFTDEFGSCGDLEFWCRVRTVYPESVFRKMNALVGVYYRNPVGASTNKWQAESRARAEAFVKTEYAKKLLYNGPLGGRLEDIYVPALTKGPQAT